MNRADKNSPSEITDASRCPVCLALNDCRLCTSEAYKGPCWCEAVDVPDELLARVPAEMRNRACICRTCVESGQRRSSKRINPARAAKSSESEPV